MAVQETPRVIVGIDGSEAGADAMTWAAAEAYRRHAPLVLAYGGDLGDNISLSLETSASVRKDTSDYGHQLLADAIATLAEDYPTVLVHTKLAEAKPATMLLDLANPHDILVVGRSGGTELERLLLGSVSRRVSYRSQCPVVLVNGIEPTSGPVLVGISTTESGLAAMRFACTEAKLRGTSVRGLRAWTPNEFTFELNGVLSYDEWRHAEEAVISSWTAHAKQEFEDLAIETELIGTSVFYALAGLSKHAQLLVVGRRRPPGGLLPRLGPITAWLTEHAECPLAIVSATEDEPADPNSQETS